MTTTELLITATEEDIKLMGALVNRLHARPCSRRREGPTCVQQEGERANHGRVRGWHNYNPDNMCSSCAAYWHVSQARNDLDDVLRALAAP